MTRTLALLALSLLITLTATADTNRFEPRKVFALFVGILEWKDPELDSFPKAGRQDRALEKALLDRGVPPSQIVFLEDREATGQRIEQTLTTLVRRAPADSTFLFYFAGHGLREGNHVYLANYDIDSAHPDRTGIDADRIVSELLADFHGNRVLLFGDFCYSGVFAEETSRFDALPRIAAAALTSSRADACSTDAWTYSESLVSIFSGNPETDRNHDGKITFAEADAFLQDQMGIKDHQLSAHGRSKTFSEDFVLSVVPH